MRTETGGRGEGFRYVWFPSGAALGLWILDFVAIPEFSSERKRVEFCGDFKAAMCLDQSPLATSSGVGLEWMGYATAASRYHQIWLRQWMRHRWSSKGLVVTVIVTQSLSSFYYSTVIWFSLLTSWWSSIRWLLLWSDTFRWVRNEGWNRGVARGACCLWSVWTDLPVSEFVILHWSRFSFVVAGFWWEALMPGGGELRFPKTIPGGDIGV